MSASERQARRINFINNVALENAAAVYGKCSNSDWYGYGGYFKGGYTGVKGEVNPTGSNQYFGVYGDVSGGNGANYGVYGSASDGSTNYGVKGFANDGITNYGVYGSASGGTANYGVYCDGSGAYTGSWSHISDRKFKKNIKPMNGILDKVMLLNPVTYEMRTNEYDFMNFNEGKQYGLIAQELEEVFPELVKDGVHPGAEEEDAPVEYKGIDYIPLTAILIEAVQEQQKTIEQLNARIEALEAQVSQYLSK